MLPSEYAHNLRCDGRQGAWPARRSLSPHGRSRSLTAVLASVGMATKRKLALPRVRPPHSANREETRTSSGPD